jgi:Tfp pilus assembly protein PilF
MAARHLLAQSQLQRGLDKEASASYELLLRQAPQDVVALNNLATLYGQAGDKRALATAEQALRLAPANPSVLDTYGWLLSESGQAKAGLAHLRKALAAQPEEPAIRWHLAVALQRSGDLRGAMDELDRLLTSRTPFPQQAEARKLMDQLRATVR